MGTCGVCPGNSERFILVVQKIVSSVQQIFIGFLLCVRQCTGTSDTARNEISRQKDDG